MYQHVPIVCDNFYKSPFVQKFTKCSLFDVIFCFFLCIFACLSFETIFRCSS